MPLWHIEDNEFGIRRWSETFVKANQLSSNVSTNYHLICFKEHANNIPYSTYKICENNITNIYFPLVFFKHPLYCIQIVVYVKKEHIINENVRYICTTPLYVQMNEVA